MPNSPPLFPVTLALYAAACALYLAQVTAMASGAASTQRGAPGYRLARAARWLLYTAFVSHAVDIGFVCKSGMHPLVNAREALSFVGWITVGAYLGATWRNKLPLAGA